MSCPGAGTGASWFGVVMVFGFVLLSVVEFYEVLRGERRDVLGKATSPSAALNSRRGALPLRLRSGTAAAPEYRP